MKRPSAIKGSWSYRGLSVALGVLAIVYTAVSMVPSKTLKTALASAPIGQTKAGGESK